MSHTLASSGVYTGKVNEAGDLIPGKPMYDAVRMFGALVEGDGYNWDFSKAMATPPPDDYKRLVKEYLSLFSGYRIFAWKLPESVLALPWLIQMYPNAYYIHWVRDGRDNILSWHGTEDDWYGVEIDLPEDRLTRAAMSWHYHEELIAQTPKPKNWLTVRFEDAVLLQQATLDRLELYLDMPLDKIPVDKRTVYRWRNLNLDALMPILQKHLINNHYMREGSIASA
jgi:hypothetical protein